MLNLIPDRDTAAVTQLVYRALAFHSAARQCMRNGGTSTRNNTNGRAPPKRMMVDAMALHGYAAAGQRKRGGAWTTQRVRITASDGAAANDG